MSKILTYFSWFLIIGMFFLVHVGIICFDGSFSDQCFGLATFYFFILVFLFLRNLGKEENEKNK